MTLNREAILASLDVKLSQRTVSVPEWGGEVNVRVMSGVERGRFELANSVFPKESIRGRLVAATACDDDGKLIFSVEDIDDLGSLSSVALDRVFEVSAEVNGIASKSVEVEVKNS